MGSGHEKVAVAVAWTTLAVVVTAVPTMSGRLDLSVVMAVAAGLVISILSAGIALRQHIQVKRIAFPMFMVSGLFIGCAIVNPKSSLLLAFASMYVTAWCVALHKPPEADNKVEANHRMDENNVHQHRTDMAVQERWQDIV